VCDARYKLVVHLSVDLLSLYKSVHQQPCTPSPSQTFQRNHPFELSDLIARLLLAMAPRGYLPVSAQPSPSLASSRLFDVGPATASPLSVLLRYLVRPKGALVVFVLTALLVMKLYLPSPTAQWGHVDEIDLSATWEQLYNASSAGWRPYEPIKRASKQQEKELQFTGGEMWSDSCLEAWIARGELCGSLELEGHEKVDLLWTWTNGSDPLLRSWRVELTVSPSLLFLLDTR